MNTPATGLHTERMLKHYLISQARLGRLVIYDDIARLLATQTEAPSTPSRTDVAQLLTVLNRHEFEEGRPLLGAIASPRRLGEPGPMFYSTAENLGIGHADDLEAHDYALMEINRVFDYWRRNYHEVE